MRFENLLIVVRMYQGFAKIAQSTLVMVVNCSEICTGYTACANKALPDPATGTHENVSAIEGLYDKAVPGVVDKIGMRVAI